MNQEIATGTFYLLAVVSKDATVIAYDKTGGGPGIILVNGALAHRKFYAKTTSQPGLRKISP